MSNPIIIIGAGHAGIQLADSLRDEGLETPIVMFTDDPNLPYQRPPLSKDFLGVEGSADPLPLRSEQFFEERGITLALGESVSEVDRDRKLVKTSGGQEHSYEHLVFATGARNRKLAIPGADLQGVHYLKTLDDARALNEQLGRVPRVLVVGGGFIGLEFAMSARAHGAEVDVLEMAPRLMGRALSPVMADHFLRAHQDQGIRVHLNEGISEIRGVDGRVAAGVGISGTEYPADLVVVGIGVIPNDDIASDVGIEVSNGIVVNEYLQTSDPNIWALGDCARFPAVGTGELVRLESVQNATDQAKSLARAISGSPSAYSEWPWFWSTQGDLRLQIAGRIDGDVEYVLRGDPQSGSFSVFCFREGSFVGAESVNHPSAHMAARRMLTHGIEISRNDAADDAFDIKKHSKRPVVAT